MVSSNNDMVAQYVQENFIDSNLKEVKGGKRR